LSAFVAGGGEGGSGKCCWGPMQRAHAMTRPRLYHRRSSTYSLAADRVEVVRVTPAAGSASIRGGLPRRADGSQNRRHQCRLVRTIGDGLLARAIGLRRKAWVATAIPILRPQIRLNVRFVELDRSNGRFQHSRYSCSSRAEAVCNLRVNTTLIGKPQSCLADHLRLDLRARESIPSLTDAL
jgi:hypothetical protein